jgi:hypothetical protein
MVIYMTMGKHVDKLDQVVNKNMLKHECERK